MASFEQILSIVKDSCSYAEPKVDERATPKGVILSREDIIPVARAMQQNPLLYFDMLSCITGIDNGPEARTMEVVYNLYSIPFNHHSTIRIILSRDNPEVESVSGVWKTADWHEREIFDMYGVVFINHPDLRRILMPADWEGHPLRKDYTHQEYYRDIKVKY
ncbi:MAG: NADH-quinone oxidoreductase subunit C [Cyclobacteriaceae bacterium]|jgi:NADH-quinone oxidoreductase subunit C|nr:NADH-quinone oxidoreductase subunit C [Cyclobacteriaceae bacterium]MDH5251296.1 NADH-quinone oxidoreductase subunit C [Cyclobacteriaceae bacterium]